jgi:hypothetical protein
MRFGVLITILVRTVCETARPIDPEGKFSAILKRGREI